MENNDFGFGFNDERFSDRTLVIELLPNPVEQVSNGLKGGTSDHSSTEATQTKTIHISTLILAGKSPFFYKLFSNGMAESNQRHVTLQIQESEEEAFIDLLKFMYTNTLSSKTQSALLNVLMAADKYEVVSCIKYCIKSLQKLPMTCESAILYLNLPSTILTDHTTQPLIKAANECLDARFTEISKFEEELLEYPLARIEAVLSRDDLQVSSEDDMYDFVMKWARKHYTKPDELHEVLSTRLLHLIRVPFLSHSKLEEVFFNATSLQVKEQGRTYKLRPVKVVRSDLSLCKQCLVYLNLKREDCISLLPKASIRSQPFEMDGHVFDLEAKKRHAAKPSFGMYLNMKNEGPLKVEFQFALRKKPKEVFVPLKSSSQNFVKGGGWGFDNLLGMKWNKFIAEDNPYFISGLLHICIAFNIRK